MASLFSPYLVFLPQVEMLNLQLPVFLAYPSTMYLACDFSEPQLRNLYETTNSDICRVSETIQKRLIIITQKLFHNWEWRGQGSQSGEIIQLLLSTQHPV